MPSNWPPQNEKVPDAKGPMTKEMIRLQLEDLSREYNVPIITCKAELDQYTKKTLYSSKAKIAYLRYSSRNQADSYSLAAQLRQIIERAARDCLTIDIVFVDAALSAYYKKDRPAINAMRKLIGDKRVNVLYIHKVDRIARRIEWFIEILNELQQYNVELKVVEQSFDLSTPEGKLISRMLSILSEFYSDNLGLETSKGRYESSMQGYHNGSKPWGYVSVFTNGHMVGVPDPKLVPIVLDLFRKYASGVYSDYQLMKWLNDQGCRTNNGNPFSKDTVRDMLQNPYYMGKVRYKGTRVRTKGTSYRSTKPKITEGKHEAIVQEELWLKCQEVRASRNFSVATQQKTAKVHLLQGLIVCAHCGRKIRAQTPKNSASYYREDSHLRGFTDCHISGRGVRTEIIDEQVAELMKSLKLPPNWEQAIKQILAANEKMSDPEVEKREIKALLRKKRENFERNMYEGDEHVYWRQVEELQEKLRLLNRVPENSYHQAADTLLNMENSWEWATKEEQHELVQMMLTDVGCDVEKK